MPATEITLTQAACKHQVLAIMTTILISVTLTNSETMEPTKTTKSHNTLWQYSELTFSLIIPNSAINISFIHLKMDIKYFGSQIILKIQSWLSLSISR